MDKNQVRDADIKNTIDVKKVRCINCNNYISSKD